MKGEVKKGRHLSLIIFRGGSNLLWFEWCSVKIIGINCDDKSKEKQRLPSPTSGGLVALKEELVATIFDKETSDNLSSLAESKKLLIEAKLKKFEREVRKIKLEEKE